MSNATGGRSVATSSAPGQQSSALAPGRAEELLRLAAVDDADLDIVRAALAMHPDDVALLLDAHAEVGVRFGAAAGLDLVPDEDHEQGGAPSVGVFVRLGAPTKAANEAFEAFRREWWLPRMRTSERGLALDCVWR